MLCLECGQKETLQYSEKCEDCESKSLGIVLWLAFIKLCLSVVISLFSLSKSLGYILVGNQIGHSGLLFSGVIFTLDYLIIIGMASYVIYLFLNRKRKMANVFICLLVVEIVFTLIEYSCLYAFFDITKVSAISWFYLIISLFWHFVWIAYFLVSEKVKQHFVR